MTPKARFCYYWIQNGGRGKSEVRRESDEVVRVLIAPGVYNLDIDVRDTRTLVCFDGTIPSGGLPKGSTVIHIEENPRLFCDLERVYKKRDDAEENPLYAVKVEEGEVIQETKRYFVLLLSGRAVFRMFKTDTLQPKYLAVDVKDGVAEFSTSSY